MSTMSLSRSQRRQMKRLGEEADRAVEGDRRYFARWPHRTYRVRLVSSAERKQLELFQGHPIRPDPGQAVFVTMKQLAPGVRLKATVVGPLESIGEELTDAEAGSVFESYADLHPQVREREAMMRAAYVRLGGKAQDKGPGAA